MIGYWLIFGAFAAYAMLVLLSGERQRLLGERAGSAQPHGGSTHASPPDDIPVVS